MFEATGWPNIPKTPHSSLNLSSIPVLSLTAASDVHRSDARWRHPHIRHANGSRSGHLPDKTLRDCRGPDAISLIDSDVDGYPAIDGNPQLAAAGLPDHAGRHAGRGSAFQHLGHIVWRRRDHNPGR